jgi:hypothetical protein
MKRVTIDFVAPPESELVLSGATPDQSQTVVISPLRVGELPQVVELVGSLFGILSGIPGGQAALDEQASEVERMAVVLYLVDVLRKPQPASEMLQLIALLTRTQLAWVHSLAPYQAAHLLIHAVIANRDFFIQSMPGVMQTMRSMRQPASSSETSTTSSIGLMPSSS